MTSTLTVKLDNPIKSVTVLENQLAQAEMSLPDTAASTSSELNPDPSQSKSKAAEAQALQACQILNTMIEKLQAYNDTLLEPHKEQIARLSVEIARKILVQKVEDRDYEIEAIVQEALSSAPTQQNITVHLNPQDLSVCQQMQQEQADSAFAHITLVPDPSVNPAECILETPKGVVKSFIDEHLERIAKALATTS